MKKIIITILMLTFCDTVFGAGIDSYTKLMLHIDGADASTTFADYSSSARTITVGGNAQIDTAQSVFGGASGLLDGVGDSLSVPQSTDFDFGSGDFTVDFRVRWSTVGKTLFFAKCGTVGSYAYAFYYDHAANKLSFWYSTNGTNESYNPSSATVSFSANTWYHIAVVRNGNALRYYVNGTQLGTDITMSATIHAPSTTFLIGRNTNFTTSADMNGWLDEFRVSKGIARWTAAFTPPTEEYSTDQLYYNVTEGGTWGTLNAVIDNIQSSHSNLTTDNSGNGYHVDIEISGNWSSADTAHVGISGIATSPACYINIYTSGSARHAGVYSTSKYRLEVTNGGIDINVGNVTIDGLQQSLTHTNAFSGQSAVSIPDSVTPVVYKNNILKLASSNSYNATVIGVNAQTTSGSTKTFTAYNNIIYGFKRPGGGVANFYGMAIAVSDYRSATNYIYNNTVYDCDYGIHATQGTYSSTHTLYARNNISMGSIIADFTVGSTSTSNSSKNMSSDATAFGSSSLTSKTASNQFTTLGSDFHLKSGADAIDAGADLSATFTTDIDGAIRSGTWDIGADEYAGGGSPTRKRMIMMN